MADGSVPQKRAYDTLDDTPNIEANPAALDPALEDLTSAQEPHPKQAATVAEQNKTKRTRIRQACDRCKSRKTKCNNQRPCAACVAAGTQCHDWRPGMDPIATQELSQASIEHLSFELAGQPASLNDLDPSFPGSGGSTTSTGTAWPLVPAAERDRRPPYPYENLFRNEDGHAEHASASSGIAQLVYLGQRVGGADEWTIPSIKYDETYERASDMERECDHDYHAMADVDGGWKVIIMLVRPFLDTTQVLWPTFHVPTFLSSLVSVKADQDPVFICLVLSIAFMSLRERRTRKDLTEETGVGLYYTYWKIRRAAPSRDWSSPTAIQGMVFLAMGCSFMASVRGAAAARALISEAVSRVFDSGLHRRHQLLDMPSEVIEARKRTLWLVYCVDKTIAVAGRPPMLRLRDVDQDEIAISDPSLSERLSSEAPSLLAYHRTAIRLYMILERVVAKINIPACTRSSAINAISREGGTRRYRETEKHHAGCDSDHTNNGFEQEIQLLDTYQYSDIPLPSRAIEEDAMYKSHLARIRSLSAFCRLLIAAHLFGIANSDMTEGSDSNVRNASEVLQWSQELLRSQIPILEKGTFPDFGPTCVMQIAQVAKALLPVIHLVQTTNQLSLPIIEYMATFQSAIELLRGLRPKVDLVVRFIAPLETYAEKLGVALPTQLSTTGSLPAHSEARPPPQETTSDGLEHHPGQTSGSGAIQALLSLSGQAKGEESAPAPAVDQGQGSAPDLDAWWASILNGTIGE